MEALFKGPKSAIYFWIENDPPPLDFFQIFISFGTMASSFSDAVDYSWQVEKLEIRVSDWQSGCDLDSICNACGIFSAYPPWEYSSG